MSDGESTVISERTRYTGNAFWAVICVAVAGAIWATKIDGRLSNIEDAIVSDRVNPAWRVSEQKKFARQLQDLNPNLKVPQEP